MADQSKVTGITLSVYPIGENDRRLTILTKERGKMQIFARGCRRPTHPLFGVTQPLIYCEYVIVEGRNYSYLQSADCRDYFSELKTDLSDIYYSTYFAEMASYFTMEGVEAGGILNLLYVTYSAMRKKLVPSEQIRRLFEFRILQYFGIGLQVFQCLECGKQANLTVMSLENGGVFCADHGRNVQGRPLEGNVLRALQYVASVPLNRLYSFCMDEELFAEFQWIVKHFLRIQVHHRFPSADMLDLL